MNKLKITILIINIIIQIWLLLWFFYSNSEILLLINNFFILINIQILSQIIYSKPSTISYKIFSLFRYGLLFIVLSWCTILWWIYFFWWKILPSIFAIIIPAIIWLFIDLSFKLITLRKKKTTRKEQDIIDWIITILISVCIITAIAIYNHRWYNDGTSLLVSITKLIFK